VGKPMNIEQQSYDLEVIAGACSSDLDNRDQVFEIADMRVRNQQGETQRGVFGVRNVRLKSRTALGEDDEMGMDLPTLRPQIDKGSAILDMTPPSVEAAREIVAQTDLLVATEIMMPDIQIPHYENKIPKDKLLLWTPAVDQLGWHVMQMTKYAKRQGWHIGIKNGKTLGSTLAEANDPNRTELIELEKVWKGLTTYAEGLDRSQLILIHRGVLVPERDKFRNALVHEVARRVKHAVPGVKLYLDPSHSYGPKLRHEIVSGTIDAMKMMDGNTHLYDGILIESGVSKTDTDQHITLDELQVLLEDLAKFRRLREPTPSAQKTSVTIYPPVNSESAVV
jgi:hypothetical protein